MVPVISLLPVLGFAFIFYKFLKKSVSSSIFFSITSIIPVLYIFGILNFLKIGSYLLFYGGIIALIISTILYKNDIFNFIKSIPFIIYIIACTIFLFLMKDAQLFFWDEFSHWGVFIKEMYYFNTLYDASSVAAHLNYPPGISIWDYFILIPGKYNEGSLYFAYFMILFSSTLMMYEKINFKKFYWIILVFFIQITVFACFGHWFSSIYVDHIIGSLFAGMILSFLVDKYKPYELIVFIFPLTAITLVKEAGLFFGLSFTGLAIIISIIRCKIEDNKSIISAVIQQKIVVVILIIAFAISFVALKSWGIRQANMGIPKEKQNLTSIVNAIISGKRDLTPEKIKEFNKRFKYVVLHQQIHKEKLSLNYNEFSYNLTGKYKKSLKLSTVGCFLFFMVMTIILIFISHSRDKKMEIGIISLYLLIVSMTYLIILYFSYLTAFGNSALRIPSYVRYINIAILPLMMIGFSLYLPFYNELNINDGKKLKDIDFKYFFVSLTVFLCFAFITKPYLKPLYSHLNNSFKKQAEAATTQIVNKLPMKSKLFVVFPIRNNGNLNIILKYSLIPLRSAISSIDFQNKNFKDMLKDYEKYDYVWFASINKNIYIKNKSLIKKKNQKQIYTLYKINRHNNNIEFEPLL